jgi:hypothetical protein
MNNRVYLKSHNPRGNTPPKILGRLCKYLESLAGYFFPASSSFQASFFIMVADRGRAESLPGSPLMSQIERNIMSLLRG